MADKSISGKQVYLEKPVKAHTLVSVVCQKLNVDLDNNNNLKHKIDDMKKQVDYLIKENQDSETLKKSSIC